MKIRISAGVLLASLCASCTSQQVSQQVSQKAPKAAVVDIHGLVIINATQTDINDVKLTIAESTRQVNVNRVLPMSEFATAFQAKEYQGRPAQLSWRQGGVSHTSQGIRFTIPQQDDGKVLTAFLTIDSSGKVKAEAK